MHTETVEINVNLQRTKVENEKRSDDKEKN